MTQEGQGTVLPGLVAPEYVAPVVRRTVGWQIERRENEVIARALAADGRVVLLRDQRMRVGVLAYVDTVRVVGHSYLEVNFLVSDHARVRLNQRFDWGGLFDVELVDESDDLIDDPAALCATLEEFHDLARLEARARSTVELVDATAAWEGWSVPIRRELSFLLLPARAELIGQLVRSRLPRLRRASDRPPAEPAHRPKRREMGRGVPGFELDDDRSPEDDRLVARLREIQAPEELIRAVEIQAQSSWSEVMQVLRAIPFGIYAQPGGEPAADQQRLRLPPDHPVVKRIESIAELTAAAYKSGVGQPPRIALLLHGPPGVGKSALAQELAYRLGTTLRRIDMGARSEGFTLKGSPRTYNRATPSLLTQTLISARVMNPVVLLDEVEKTSASQNGDPQAALLMALDPEQSRAFIDDYLEVPIDLSRVAFVATANDIDAVSPALRDRFEVIDCPGYDDETRLAIAREVLIPRILTRLPVAPDEAPVLLDDALEETVRVHSRGPGLRSLERALTSVLEQAALEILHGRPRLVDVTAIRTWLGRPLRGEAKVGFRPAAG